MSECTHDCSSCGENCPSRQSDPADFLEAPNELSCVRRVIGVVSGKGGVGKSLVTSMLAVLLLSLIHILKAFYIPHGLACQS